MKKLYPNPVRNHAPFKEPFAFADRIGPQRGEVVQPLGDLERLPWVMDTIPDEPLMRILEHARGRGRNDYPVPALGNSVLAGVVFQHPTMESLRRELNRNGPWCELVGFGGVAPSAWAYTRFLHQILQHPDALDAVIHAMIETLYPCLPHLGERLAIDRQAIGSFAKHGSAETTQTGERKATAGSRRAARFGERSSLGSVTRFIRWWMPPTSGPSRGP